MMSALAKARKNDYTLFYHNTEISSLFISFFKKTHIQDERVILVLQNLVLFGGGLLPYEAMKALISLERADKQFFDNLIIFMFRKREIKDYRYREWERYYYEWTWDSAYCKSQIKAARLFAHYYPEIIVKPKLKALLLAQEKETELRQQEKIKEGIVCPEENPKRKQPLFDPFSCWEEESCFPSFFGRKTSASSSKNLPLNFPIITAAKEGNLALLQQLFSKENENEVKIGLISETLLCAAKADQLSVVNYLIQNYYLSKPLSDKEQASLRSLSKNKSLSYYYLELFNLFWQQPMDCLRIEGLVNEVGRQYVDQDCSCFYFLYLQMQINRQTKASTVRLVRQTNPLNLQEQLSSAQQRVLLLQMLQKGYLLDDWVLQESEVTLSDIILEPGQVATLMTLLERNQYKFYSTWNKTNFMKDKRSIGLALTAEGDFYYTVMTAEKSQEGLIEMSQLIEKNQCIIELSNPFTLDQCSAYLGSILDILAQRKHILPQVYRLALSHVQFTPEGLAALINLLNENKYPLLLPNLESISLQHCEIDSKRMNKLKPILIKRSRLRELNLDHNDLEMGDLESLLKAFTSEDARAKLQSLSMCFNNIEISGKGSLNRLRDRAAMLSLKLLSLEGNMIVPHYRTLLATKKDEYRQRRTMLMQLFRLLAEQNKEFTVENYFSATEVQFKARERLLSFKISLNGGDLHEVTLKLSEEDFQSYEDLRKIADKNYIETFHYLNEGIGQYTLPESLRSQPLSQETHPLKTLCGQVLNYHKDAKIKEHLKRYSLFASQAVEKAPSFLYPQNCLTLQDGFVYLLANNPEGKEFIEGIFKEHAFIAYEYLTSYGQRIFRVFHLRNEKQEQTINLDREQKLTTKVKIETTDLPVLFSLLRTKIIAPFPAPVKGLKEMEEKLLEDVKDSEDNNFKMNYKKIIFVSSDGGEGANCLTYCIRLMEQHLNRQLNMISLDFIPSSVVKKLKENPDYFPCREEEGKSLQL